MATFHWSAKCDAQFVPELFQIKEWERNGRADVQTLITPKGRETFRLLMEKRVG
jgi:phage antirepressor YoqD-like protein